MESITLQFRSLLCFSEPPGCPLPPGTESVDLGPFEMVLFWPQRTNLRTTEPHRNGKCWCSSMSLLEVFAAPTLLVIPCLTSVCSSWLHALISADLARSWVLSTEPSAWSMFVKKKKKNSQAGGRSAYMDVLWSCWTPCLLEAVCSEADLLATYPV